MKLSIMCLSLIAVIDPTSFAVPLSKQGHALRDETVVQPSGRMHRYADGPHRFRGPSRFGRPYGPPFYPWPMYPPPYRMDSNAEPLPPDAHDGGIDSKIRSEGPPPTSATPLSSSITVGDTSVSSTSAGQSSSPSPSSTRTARVVSSSSTSGSASQPSSTSASHTSSSASTSSSALASSTSTSKTSTLPTFSVQSAETASRHSSTTTRSIHSSTSTTVRHSNSNTPNLVTTSDKPEKTKHTLPHRPTHWKHAKHRHQSSTSHSLSGPSTSHVSTATATLASSSSSVEAKSSPTLIRSSSTSASTASFTSSGMSGSPSPTGSSRTTPPISTSQASTTASTSHAPSSSSAILSKASKHTDNAAPTTKPHSRRMLYDEIAYTNLREEHGWHDDSRLYPRLAAEQDVAYRLLAHILRRQLGHLLP